jgi:ubiquinone/menaquinone biosynthesis C-methylase UbiE
LTAIETESFPAPPRVKAKRPKDIGFFESVREPEEEAMDDSEEVEAYASAAAQSHLDAIDDTFVAHAQLLIKGRERGRALDIGTGPGQIVMKLGYRLTRWKLVGVDRSAAMIAKARESLETAPELAGRVEFRVADGNSLEFSDGSFDLVICNSVLHHLAEPQKLFAEIARVVKPGGAILLRDLRRPTRFEFSAHVKKHGKHYDGEMKRLYVASVHAAYTEEELQKMLAVSPLRNVRVFRHGKTHIGFERAIVRT